MRHDLLPLPIAPGPPGVREAARTRVLVAATGLAQARLARLLPTVHAAVALSAVAPAAQQHLALARRTRERPPWLVHATPGPNSRHRPLRSEPPRALRGRLCSSVGRVPSDGAILRAHCVLCTVGRGGLNNWLVVLAAAPVLIPSGGTVLLRNPPHVQGPPRPRCPVEPTTCDDYLRRLPKLTLATLRMPPLQACPRRRSVGACDEPTDRRGGQAVFAAVSFPAPGLNATKSAGDQLPSPSADP